MTLRPDATTTAADLHDRCRNALAKFKVPARIEILDAFPVTTGTNGTKIRAAELRERAAAMLAQADGTTERQHTTPTPPRTSRS